MSLRISSPESSCGIKQQSFLTLSHPRGGAIQRCCCSCSCFWVEPSRSASRLTTASAAADIKAWAKRKKMGGNKKRKYIEGWVEFLDKKIAKRVAATLNGTQIGGRKGSMYYDDLWVMKYLPRFKWHHLTERIGEHAALVSLLAPPRPLIASFRFLAAYDNAVRDQRLQLHMDQVRRETATFVENVAQSKKFKAMEERHSKKRKQQAQDVVEGESADEQEDAPSRTIRKVKQRVARV
eukprot:m.80990 g.80990  ORF g.80990 m.80990 type:complete len:237 (+) comp8215_c0_seq1:1377-2087(+)